MVWSDLPFVVLRIAGVGLLITGGLQLIGDVFGLCLRLLFVDCC